MVEEEERLGWGGSWLMGEVGGRQGKEELRRQDHAKFIIKVAEEPPPATAAHLFVCAGDKAGMTDRQQSEKDKIASKIYEMSRNSNFLKHAEKLDKDLDERIARLREILVALKPSALHDFTSVTDRQLREWEKERRFDRVIVHVDMDMFFVAVELLERPELSDRPVAVGDVKMISTANYEARKYGVRSAMPGWMGQELCPSLELLPLNFCKYQAVSAKVKEILGEFDPHFSSFSLDEASLDLTDYLLKRLGRCSGSISPEELFAEGEVVVADIRRRIQEATQLTASAGIASNFFLAKVASDINKPDGQFSIHPDKDEVLRFLQDLPLRKLPGVGKVTEKILKELLGVSTCGALMVHRGAVWALFSEKSRKSLLMKCLGIGRSEHDPPAPDGVVTRKVISCERSFAAVGASGLEDVLIKLCQRLGEGESRMLVRCNSVC
jgi:DNA polymerase kappa